MENLKIFTVGDEKKSPFRFNPFEMIRGESLTSHVDMLKAAFISAFVMEAAMPQIIEAAIYNAYENYGWDLNTSENEYCSDPWNAGGFYWPTFTDLIKSLDTVVENYKFAPELNSNYKATLKSRLSNFTIGVKGSIFNCKLSMDLAGLMDEMVIFELEDIKSPEDKILIMGFMLARLNEIIKRKFKENKEFKHITVVEEAHRLLSKFEYGDSNSKKHSVTMFTDMLAEVRKYGESLIIIDQIPNKLAPEVLKNTNTKIIHRLFAQDDKDAVGNTMAMEDGQKKYLSMLRVGEAVIFSQNWHKPVHAMILSKLTDKGDMPEEKIIDIGLEMLLKNQHLFFPALHFAGLSFDREDARIYFTCCGKFMEKFSACATGLSIKLNEDAFKNFEHFVMGMKDKFKMDNDKFCELLAYEIIIRRGSRYLPIKTGKKIEEVKDILKKFLSGVIDAEKTELEESSKNTLVLN